MGRWFITGALLALWLSAACSNPLNPSCTVGVAGTDMQITATGSSAQDFCDGFVGSTKAAYVVDNPDDSGTLMCRYTLTDDTVIIVRDRGALKLYGTAECQALENRWAQRYS